MTAPRPAPARGLAPAAPYLAVPALVLLFHARAVLPGQAFVGEDLRYFFHAMREATAAALREGHLPGWQRGIFLGYPLLADPQAAALAPATWLTLPWEAPRALTLATLLHLCVAGWGMVRWARVRGLGGGPALLGAVLFALGAKQTVHLQHWNFAASTAFWPWALAGLDAFALRGRGRSLLLTASACALSWLGGAAQMAYFGTLVAGAYALALAPALWRRRPADAALAIAAAPLGLLLAAPIALPVAELARLGPRGAGVAYAFASSWRWPDGWGLALLVLPRAFGGAWRTSEMNLWEATGYLGLLPMALAAAAPLRRRGLWVFAALGVVGVWLCWGDGAWLGLHHLLYRFLPGYGTFRNPTRALMVTSFAGALLAAEGLEALARGGDGLRARLARAAAVLAALLAAAAVLPRLASLPLDRAAAAAGAPAAIALALLGLGWLAARAASGGGAAGGAWVRAAVGLALLDVLVAFGDMNPVGPADAERPALAELAPEVPEAPAPRRVAVIAKWGRTANAPLRNGWEGAGGYGPTVIERVRGLLLATRTDRLAPPSPVTEDTNLPRPDPTSALWPLLGTPLVVSDVPRALPRAAEARPEWEDPLVAYRAQALPRVFWTGAWTTVPDDEVAAPLLAAAKGDRAVLAPGAAPGFDERGGPAAGPVAASAVEVRGGALRATVEAPRPGIAVVLEPWFPGWSATLDGAPAPLARADYAFMAVPVAAGRHELRLSYAPRLLGPGVAVAAAAFALLGAALWARRRTGRPRAASSGSGRA